ncbi:MAG: cell division protein FtsQ/DivIB [Candidatus Omnitrophota bacterium]
MKKYKIKLPARLKKRRALPVKFIIFCAVIIFAVIFIAGYTWVIFRNSDYFKIKDVLCKEAAGVDLSYLKGKNIFALNLERESRYIQGFHPDYKRIKLVRVFPDRIFAYFIKRKPAALVKLYKYFIMDEEGVLCNAPADLQGLELPQVTGLETKLFGPSVGKSYDIKEIALALEAIREFQRNRAFKNYKIKRIDVRAINDATLFLLFPPEAADFSKGLSAGIAYEGLQVKLGEGNIRRKLSILAGVITRGKLDLANIKYIDLRFAKPVIKYAH